MLRFGASLNPNHSLSKMQLFALSVPFHLIVPLPCLLLFVPPSFSFVLLRVYTVPLVHHNPYRIFFLALFLSLQLFHAKLNLGSLSLSLKKCPIHFQLILSALYSNAGSVFPEVIALPVGCQVRGHSRQFLFPVIPIGTGIH